MNIFKKKPNAPWSKYYNAEDMELEIPNSSFFDYFEKKVEDFGGLYALDYYGNKFKYSELLRKIDECARGLYDYGVRKGDVVTICLPNTVEAVISFFAINKIGGIANFLHSASGENEIRDSLNETKSKILILLDLNYLKYKNIENDTTVNRIILVNLYNYMPFISRCRYNLERKIKFDFKLNSKYIFWNIFIFQSKKLNIGNYVVNGKRDDPAIILHSGGTTGTPKGVVLLNRNIIAFVESAIIGHGYFKKNDVVLAIMPIFHCLGLIHNVLFPLCIGMNVILRYKFDICDYCKMIVKYKPQFLSGVPSLFESLVENWNYKNVRLDFLKYILIGGDVLKDDLKCRINNFLTSNGANIRASVGYGLTETAGGVALGNPYSTLEKKEAIGIPLPGVFVGIFSSSDEEVSYGEEGEICVCGPTVMQGYYNNEKETNMALHVHKDGNIWLHTGDIGSMDEDGYLTYLSRQKRMIVSSGYNVYPSRIEQLLESHPAVMLCAVVGVPHKRKIEVPKVYVVLNKGYIKSEFLVMEFKKLCSKNLPKYAWPYEYEFRESLPVTRVGKIDFKSLQKK